jgi:hypothetical protein
VIKGIVRRVGAGACTTALVAATVVLSSTGVLAGTGGRSAEPAAHQAQSRSASAHVVPRTRAGVVRYLQSIGVDPDQVVFEDGVRNYAGPRCPGRRWTCTPSSQPVVQFAPRGGVNRVDCPRSGRCVVVQVAAAAADNSATCLELGRTQSCSISQSNTTGSNSALVIELAVSLEVSRTRSQTISITQTNLSGSNTADVWQSMTLSAARQTSTRVVTEALDGYQSIGIAQDAVSGANVVQGTTGNGSQLIQSQTISESATGPVGVSQEADGLSAGPNMALDIGQNQNTPTATGTNSSAFNQTSAITTTAVTPNGPVSQTVGSPGGGLSATVNQFSAGVSANVATQSEHQTEQASTTAGGSILPPGTVQTEFGPVRCCSLQGTDPGDTFEITQSSTQCAGSAADACAPGADPGAELADSVTGTCETSGECSVAQIASVEGVVTTNDQSGKDVETTTTCSGTACETTPTLSIGAVCVNDLTVALNGGVNWEGEAPGSLSFDWGNGYVDNDSSFPNARTYAKPGTYTITVTGTDVAGGGQAMTTVTVGPGEATCSYVFVPAARRIAPEGRLGADQSVGFAVEVLQDDEPLNGAPVWLRFIPTEGGGSATACCDSSAASTSLSGAPQPFVTGTGGSETGEVDLTYTTPSTLPESGMDTVRATDTPHPSTGVKIDDTYTFFGDH